MRELKMHDRLIMSIARCLFVCLMIGILGCHS